MRQTTNRTGFPMAFWLMIALLASTLPAAQRAPSTLAAELAEVEPNDSMAQASALTVGYGSAVANATIATGADRDYYVFQAEANSTYVIETFDMAGTKGLFLYDPSGALLSSDGYGMGGNYNVDARIVYTFPRAGSYYVQVGPSYWGGGQWAGTYSVRVLPKHDSASAYWNPDDDYEPNDVLPLALELRVGLEHARTHKIGGPLYPSSEVDVDSFFFTATAGATYVIETFGLEGTKGLFLYDAEGTYLAKDDYGMGGSNTADARIVYRTPKPGTYYVVVGHSSWGGGEWTGTYSIRVLPKYDEPGAAWDTAADYEPNDELALANEIGIGSEQALTRTIAQLSYTPSSTDRDWYRFQAEAGTPYVIETFDMTGIKGLFLHNAEGALLASNGYGTNNAGNVTSRLVYTPTHTGTYFVLVGDSHWGGAEWTGTYSVRVCANSCRGRLFLPLIRR